jgi:hypothetical protein
MVRRGQRGRTVAMALGVLLAVALGGCATGAAAAGAASTPQTGTATPTATPSPTVSPSPSPSPSPSALPEYALVAPASGVPKVAGATYFSWSLLDRTTGALTGSANAAAGTNTVESMIKPWIVADYLRRLSAAGKEPTESILSELTLTIVDSNNELAQKYYEAGGSDAVVERLAKICGLSDVGLSDGWWSMTELTSQDTVRYGQCVADGRAAGPEWTPWLLETMKQIRGGVADQVSDTVEGGRWGIIDGLPTELASQISFKNGWTSYKDGWHVNCLAISSQWILAIMMRRPGTLQAAADGCANVTAALVTPLG